MLEWLMAELKKQSSKGLVVTMTTLSVVATVAGTWRVTTKAVEGLEKTIPVIVDRMNDQQLRLQKHDLEIEYLRESYRRLEVRLGVGKRDGEASLSGQVSQNKPFKGQ